jgi:hypothetical protein
VSPEIIYRRKDPTDARVHKWWVQWMMVTMMAFAALASFSVGAVLLLFPEL